MVSGNVGRRCGSWFWCPQFLVEDDFDLVQCGEQIVPEEIPGKAGGEFWMNAKDASTERNGDLLAGEYKSGLLKRCGGDKLLRDKHHKVCLDILDCG